jgi:hypothetical protein
MGKDMVQREGARQWWFGQELHALVVDFLIGEAMGVLEFADWVGLVFDGREG